MQPNNSLSSGPFLPSELILRPDGSLYHLGVGPDDVASTVVIVGDPDRVATVAERFDEVHSEGASREFHFMKGQVGGKELTVLSSGIGVDNIDIVLNELDAAVNIDLETRTAVPDPVSLNIVRLGTSGTFGADIELGSIVTSKMALGMDGLPYHYDVRMNEMEEALSHAFSRYIKWNTELSHPYAVAASPELMEQYSPGTREVITLTANGFYGPQLRALRLPLAGTHTLNDLQSFAFRGIPLGNFEMECAGIYALAAALGHRAITLCTLLAQRAQGRFVENPEAAVNGLLDHFFDRFTR